MVWLLPSETLQDLLDREIRSKLAEDLFFFFFFKSKRIKKCQLRRINYYIESATANRRAPQVFARNLRPRARRHAKTGGG